MNEDGESGNDIVYDDKTVFQEEEMNKDGLSGNDIVHDAKTVFQEEEMNEDGESGNDIVYDDKTVAALLDRSQEGIEEKESWANEYLSSFKVILQRLFTQFWELKGL